MATYHEWNNAILNYVTQGLSIGARVFLSIDNEKIEAIGFTFGTPRPSEGWSQDFIRSVRSVCVYRERIQFSRIIKPSLRDTQQRPRYVAFLAAMVLAANNMGDDIEEKTIDPKDYYTHFNNLLDLYGQDGRPEGLKGTDIDEKLWLDWSAWLRSQGFLPTAHSGEGAYKYIEYPISQTLLRQSDKNRLWRHFNNSVWRKDYDEVLLIQKVRKDSQYLTKHLQQILDPKGDMWLRSYDAISSACYEVYEEWRESNGGDVRLSGTGPRIRTSLDARIYRSEDFFSGLVQYRIFPRQIRQSFSAYLQAEYKGVQYSFTEDRPGWFAPLWPLDGNILSTGLKIPITSKNSPITTMYLPARDFWVLTLDPDTPDSGIYASWDKSIDLGTEFILLVHERITSDLNKLKDEGLLEWQTKTAVFDGWIEYQGVTVQSEPQAWNIVNLENDSLRLTLQPHTIFSINFIGGLRAHRGNGWFVGHEPRLSLASFYPGGELNVFNENEEMIHTSSIEAGKQVNIPWQGSGNYRVVVELNGQSDEKIVRILDWTNTTPRLMDFDHIAEENKFSIYGAFVRE